MHAEAVRDMREGASWYDERRGGLGDEFLALIDDAVHAIERSPETGVSVDDQFRMKLLPRFPYGIVFRERPNSIHIVAVHHYRRDAAYWAERALGFDK